MNNPQMRSLSLPEYLQLNQNTLDARYEYVDGAVRLLAGGSAEHDRIARNIANAIELHFQSGPCTVFGSDVQVLVGVKSDGKENYFYPDVTVSCDVADRRRGTKLIRSPRITVEVLSPGTEAYDRGKKLERYKACSTIQEIVLVNQYAQHVEIYRRDEKSSKWEHVFYSTGEVVLLESVDVQMTMDEIYKNIDFDEPLIAE